MRAALQRAQASVASQPPKKIVVDDTAPAKKPAKKKPVPKANPNHAQPQHSQPRRCSTPAEVAPFRLCVRGVRLAAAESCTMARRRSAKKSLAEFASPLCKALNQLLNY